MAKRNRVEQYFDDERDFSPEECRRICDDAMAAAEKVFEEGNVDPAMRDTVMSGFRSIAGTMQLNLGANALVKGVKLRKEAESGAVLAKMIEAFFTTFRDGVNVCAAKGGSPDCRE
jgi:hypothetical protein